MKRRVIDSSALKSLYPPMDEGFERDMLRTIQSLPQKREEKIVKKKISIGLALAIVLIVATTVTALAFTLSRAFFEDVAKLQLESGYYDAWTLKEKLGMLELMQKSGVQLEDAAVNEILHGEMSDAQREQRLDALMAERYGGERRITQNIGIESILYSEMGPMTAWSLEDKAWYSQMLMNLGLLGYDTNLNLLPADGAISPEEAADAARAAVEKAFGISPQEMERYAPLIDYGLHRSEHAEKEPYYTVHFALKGADGTVDHKEPKYEYDYTCYVAGDGSILCKTDGYLYIESPQDAVERKTNEEAESEISRAERLTRHREAAQALAVATYTLSEANGMEGAIALRDGTVLVHGAATAAEGYFEGMDIGERTPYALCLDETGTVRWRLALAGRGSVQCAMQIAGGDILLYVAEGDFGCGPYRQVTLSETGEVLAQVQLPTTLEMTGVKEEQDQNFAAEGHEGFLLSSSVGQTHTKFFAQLDAQGKVVWAKLYEELTGYGGFLVPIQAGYLFYGMQGGYTDGAPLLYFMDRQGNAVRTNEKDADERLRGHRILRLRELQDGSLIANGERGGIGGTPFLAKLTGQGAVEWIQTCEEIPIFVSSSGTVQTEGGFVYALRHNISEYTGGAHLGLLKTGEDGKLHELYPEGTDDMAVMSSGLHLLPIGEGKLALVCDGYVGEGEDETRPLRMSVLEL